MDKRYSEEEKDTREELKKEIKREIKKQNRKLKIKITVENSKDTYYYSDYRACGRRGSDRYETLYYS